MEQQRPERQMPHIDREPSLVDTRMADIRSNPALRARLIAKLEEYRQRNAEMADELAEPQRPYDQSADMAVFKEAILSVVLELSADERRDTEHDPITILDVVLPVQEKTKRYVSPAVATPFIWSDERHVYEPDYERLRMECGPVVETFATAYAIIQAYAADRPDLLVGGSGLPEASETEPGA